jgi:SAM-dependent methyltransferase
MTFKDHFSKQASDYAQHRPDYPDLLIEAIVRMVPEPRARAVDVACGSGQATVMLADHFEQVIGVDPSRSQLSNAPVRSNVAYLVGAAEALPFEDRSVDLLTVGQGLHWFDLLPFWREAGRVIRPGGIFAAWTYWLPSINIQIDALLMRYFHDVVGPYWPPERKDVDNGYADIAIPFADVHRGVLKEPMTATWEVDRFLGFLSSWSGSQRYRDETGKEPLDEIAPPLKNAWGSIPRPVAWPITLITARV